MYLKRFKKLVFVSYSMSTLVLFLTSPSLFSQSLELEEITVTARKTQVELQDAAIAVSVTSGEDFDKSNVMKLDNFNGYVPKSSQIIIPFEPITLIFLFLGEILLILEIVLI